MKSPRSLLGILLFVLVECALSSKRVHSHLSRAEVRRRWQQHRVASDGANDGANDLAMHKPLNAATYLDNLRGKRPESNAAENGGQGDIEDEPEEVSSVKSGGRIPEDDYELVEVVEKVQDKKPTPSDIKATFMSNIWIGGMKNATLSLTSSVKNTSAEAKWSVAKDCPRCQNGGVCNPQSGSCNCPSGWKGTDCSADDLWPCDLTSGERINSRCAGECDMRTNKCYCGKRGKFPNRPLRYCDPIGIAELLQWSEVEMSPQPWHHIYANSTKGVPNEMVEMAERPEEYDNKSAPWCDADLALGQVEGFRCTCLYEGLQGKFCEVKVPHVCPNQCSGRGRCEHGFCHCEDGWVGVDCSIPPLVGHSNHVGHTPPSAKSSIRIYVYELPARFNVQILQRRQNKALCVSRTYEVNEDTGKVTAHHMPWYYSSEFFLHEYFLKSPLRTLDPNQADFFYVPVYGSCYIQLFNEPSPRLKDEKQAISPKGDFVARTVAAAQLYKEVWEWVSETHPFWRRSGGRDHIFTFAYDEGSCIAPREIRPAILLTRWGQSNSHWPVGKAFCGYSIDKWGESEESINNETGIIGKFPCFDPAKDLVIPAWKPPSLAAPPPPPSPRRGGARGRMRGTATASRPKLFFFAGDLGTQPDIPESGPHNEINYSGGIRQNVTNMWRANRWNQNLTVAGHLMAGEYREALQTHKFCGVLPGDGWSGNFESAILAGCIPAIIQDGVYQPFENIFNFSAISVRIPESEIDNMVSILEAIPPDEVQRMQRSISFLRDRFVYRSPLLDHNGEISTSHSSSKLEMEGVYELDAFDTIIDFLTYKRTQLSYVSRD